MDFTIISLGNVEFLSMVLNGVAMICGTGNYTRLVAVGFVIGLLYIGFQCIFEGAQKINLHHTFLCFLCFLCMFGPSCTCVVEDAYTGKVRTVDNLPLGVGVAGAAISGIGYGVTRMLEQGFGTYDRTSEHQFAEPLRILNKVRSVAQSEQLFQAINNELGTRANGAPSDSKQAIINYLSECTMAKIQLGEVSPTQLYNSTWDSEAFKFSSDAHTVLLPIGGMGSNEVVTCNAGYAKLNTIFQKFSSTSVKTAINQFLHLKNDDGTTIATNMDKVDNAMQALNATMNGSQDYMQMVVLEGVYKQAAIKFYGSQQDTASAIAVNQGIMQRNTQWAAEGTMFLSASRALMAFFEGFIYAITPIMGFLIAIGSFGIGLVGKYFLTIAWIQLWLPILSILNLYIMTGARSAITDANLGIGASFYAIDTLWSETATWVATGGMLTAATPMLALFLVSGSTFAFTSLAGRLNGQDHFNERIATPDAVSPSAVMSHAPYVQADRMSGVRVSGSDATVAKVDLGAATAATVSSRAGVMQADQNNLTATVNRAVTDGQSNQQIRSLQQSIGQSVGSTRVDGQTTAMEKMNSSTATAGMTSTQKEEALGALSMALSGGGGLDIGARYGEFKDADGKTSIKGGLIGKAAAALGVSFEVGADGGLKFTGTSTATDSYADSSSQSRDISRQGSAKKAETAAANLSKGYQSALQNISSKTWADMAQKSEGTTVGASFGKLSTSTKAYENAVSSSQTFGLKQNMTVTALAEQLKGTAAGKELANFERTSEGRAANLSASAQKYADMFGGDLEKGKIAAAIDYLAGNNADPASQMRLGATLADAKIPTMGVVQDNASKYEGLRKPVDAEVFVRGAEAQIKREGSQIHQDKPSEVSYNQGAKTATEKFNQNKTDVGHEGNSNLNSVMGEAQKTALQDLQQGVKTSSMAQFANDWLKDGMFDSLVKYLGDSNTPSPTEIGQRGSDHYRSIRGLSEAQTEYLSAYHSFQKEQRAGNASEIKFDQGKNFIKPDSSGEDTQQRLDKAYSALKNEMRQVLYGDKELSREEQTNLGYNTMAMASQLIDVHDLDHQASANTVTRFNTAYGLKPKN